MAYISIFDEFCSRSCFIKQSFVFIKTGLLFAFLVLAMCSLVNSTIGLDPATFIELREEFKLNM